MAVRSILRGFQGLAKHLERFQVELQGRYSADRLQQFVQYSHSVTACRVVTVLLLTAAPCALAIVLVDILPLQPPSSALTDQTATYWVRAFYSGFVVTGTSLLQWNHASARLPLKLIRIAVATIINATGTNLLILASHLLVGFPTPFLYQAISIPWQVMLAAAFWMLCKDTVRAYPAVKLDLVRFVYLWTAEVTMIIVYPILNYVFRSLDGDYQTIFSMCLPLWKLVLKNWCRAGTDRLEDLTPVLVVFNVDVFHALFLASAMQSSSSTGSSTLAVVMAVDLIQSCLAVLEVYIVLARIKKLASQIQELAGQPTAIARYFSHCSSITQADSVLSSSPQIREQLMVAGSQQIIHPLSVRPVKTLRGSAITGTIYLTTTTDASNTRDTAPTRRNLEKIDAAKLAFVQANLKLLHMVEFYMLIEFTEVLIAIVYSTYLLAMAQLPNRQFYFPLMDLTDEQFATTVRRVMKYAALEMLSFVLLVSVFDCMLRISTLRQLAFTLEKHWLLVQSLLVLWVFFPTQMTLEHLGCDYTFKFAWLHSRHPNSQ